MLPLPVSFSFRDFLVSRGGFFFFFQLLYSSSEFLLLEFFFFFFFVFWLRWVFFAFAWSFSSGKWGPLFFVAGRRLLIAVASVVVEHDLYAHRLQWLHRQAP